MRPGAARKLALFFFAAFLFAAFRVQAQSIIVNDCQGFTRATKQVQPGETNSVGVQVSAASGAAADGTTLQLTNVVSSQVFTANVTGGAALFENVGPGVYALSAPSSGLGIGAITIGTGGMLLAGSGALSGGTLLLGGAAAGGVAAGVVAASGGFSGGSSHSPTPTPTPLPTPTPGPRPRPTATPCPVCNPNAAPTPINNFFNSQQNPNRTAGEETKTELTVLSPYR